MLVEVRKEAADFFSSIDLPEKTKEQMIVALGEACTNSIRHSYGGKTDGTIEVTLEEQADKLLIKVRDFGQKIDLSQVREPEIPPSKPHGLGIYFMKTIMDKIEYTIALPQGNEVVLIKYKKLKNENKN